MQTGTNILARTLARRWCGIRTCGLTACAGLHGHVHGAIVLLLLALLGGRSVLVISVQLQVSAEVDHHHVQKETDGEWN